MTYPPLANSAGRGAGSDTCKVLFDLGNVLGILWLLFDPDNNMSVVAGIPDLQMTETSPENCRDFLKVINI